MLERILRWTLVAIAVAGLTAGGLAHVMDRSGLADFAFAHTAQEDDIYEAVTVQAA
jgi:hypothetical protein